MRGPRIPPVVVVLVAAVLLFSACATPPSDASPIPAGGASGPSSGRASSENNTNDMPIAGGNAMPGSTQENSAVSAKYQPTRQNTATGSLVTGFVQGLTGEQRSKVASLLKDTIDADVGLESIHKEMKWLMDSEEYSETWQARMDKLRTDYAAARDRIVAELRDTGAVPTMDLQSLETLIVVGIIGGNAGNEEIPVTNEQAAKISEAIPKVVEAARWKKVLNGGPRNDGN